MSDEFLMFAIGLPAAMVAITFFTGILIWFVNKFFPSNAELSRRDDEYRMKTRGECKSLLGLTGVPLSNDEARAEFSRIMRGQQ